MWFFSLKQKDVNKLAKKDHFQLNEALKVCFAGSTDLIIAEVWSIQVWLGTMLWSQRWIRNPEHMIQCQSNLFSQAESKPGGYLQDGMAGAEDKNQGVELKKQW